jgi:sodium/hydrogen antiporter
VVSFLAGILLGPLLGVLQPLSLAQGNPENVESITYHFSHLVLGVQLVIAGIQLPQRYLVREWKTLAVLLLPGLTAMWLCSSLFIWLTVPDLGFLFALAIGACVSPTDPVLSSSIVKGRFADENVPVDLQRIIITESGVNDGLGYPFLFLPLFLYFYSGSRSESELERVLFSVQRWIGETLLYDILLSVIFGAVIGLMAKYLLQGADARSVNRALSAQGDAEDPAYLGNTLGGKALSSFPSPWRQVASPGRNP